MFVHVVYFWLNENTPPAARDALLRDCTELLGGIPGVRQIHAGRPAMTPRPVVDNSYDIGLCVILEDRAAHDVYQDHDLHKQFIAAHGSIWKRVQVYDFA